MPLIPDTMNPTTAGGILGSGPDKNAWVNLLTGKKLSDSKSDETSFKKSDLPQNHRVVDHDGGMMTMDHDENRLNVFVDKDGTVKKVTHG